MKRIEIISFFLIIILASFLRLYRITQDPPHLYWDEASIAYNAYSINLTGKDEWGEKFPVFFKAFGEYKFPLYIYTTALSQKLIGLGDLAVRLPSALAGVLTVAMVYFLARRLKLAPPVALMAMFFLAISPWHLQFSRAGFEANVAVLFLTAGIYLFLRRTFFLSFLLFAAAIYTYQATLVMVPLILAILGFLFHRELRSNGKKILFAVLLFVVVMSPFVSSYLFSPAAQTRARSENFLQMPGVPVTNFVNNYVAGFSLDYLFFHGDQDGRHSVKKLGELYLWQLPTVLAGIYVLIRQRSKMSLVILSLVLIGSLPPALTTISPHALRGLFAVIGWQIISAVGTVYLLSRLPLLWRFLAIPILAYALVVYLHLYFVHFPVAYAVDWQDGQRQTVLFIKKIEANYNRIYVYKDLQPIYIELYWPFSPGALKTSKITYFDFDTFPQKKNPEEKNLIVLPPWAKFDSGNILHQIKNGTGDAVFNIYDF